MASALTQQLFSSARNISFPPIILNVIGRNKSTVVKGKQRRGTIKYRNLIASDCQSLADRGFLRSQKPYDPPSDAGEKVKKIAEKFLGSEFKLTDSIPKEAKFSLLSECWKVFDYAVPNSQLHKITKIDDMIQFYTTPIRTTTPYDDLKKMDLPPNLHIQHDYVRFDSQTDEKFDGISAFPESPTIITNLKARKKYKSEEKQLPKYYYNEAYYKTPF